MSAVTASGREIHHKERLACKSGKVFHFRGNSLIHCNLGSLHLEVELLRHTVSKRIATERSNFFLQLGFFFFLLLDGCCTHVLQLLLVALADSGQRILRELERISRILNLLVGFLDAQNKVVNIKFSLELVADANELVCKLKTEQVRELGVVRSFFVNGHSSTCRNRSLGNRLCTGNRINVIFDLIVIAFSHHSAVRAGFFVTLTSNCGITLANSLQGINNHLNLETRILAGLHVIENGLDESIFVNFFAHLARNNRKVLTTELGTQHVSKLFIIGRIGGNSGRALFNSLFTIACHETKCSQCCRTKNNLLHVHYESP